MFGSPLAILSRLLPTDVHFTVAPNSSNWQLQFPATEHKTGGPKPLPPSPLPDPGGGNFRCGVAEMTKLHTRMWTPQNIVWCYFESKWLFEWSSTHGICSQSSIQAGPNEQITITVDILLISEYSIYCYSIHCHSRSQNAIVENSNQSKTNTCSLVYCNALKLWF